MSFAQRYLNQQQHLSTLATSSFDMAVVIPCFNEPYLHQTLECLMLCSKPQTRVLVLVVVNSPEHALPEALQQNAQSLQWMRLVKAKLPDWMQLETIEVPNIPRKLAGAGWARKLGMDAVLHGFAQQNKPRGIIVSLDADCTVEPTYLVEIERFFAQNPSIETATIAFEHPIDELPPHSELTEAMTHYELYMRYYRQTLRYTGFPHAFHSIGSCMAVAAHAYALQGGMNRKQAGEDFYFLHKMAQLGPIGEIKTTKVYPGIRVSDRVPYGTGPALAQWLQGNTKHRSTYPLSWFEPLKHWFSQLNCLYERPFQTSGSELLDAFLRENQYDLKIAELQKHCSNLGVFKTRFYHLFNALSILKWLNYVNENGFEKNALTLESIKLLMRLKPDLNFGAKDPKFLLNLFRELES